MYRAMGLLLASAVVLAGCGAVDAGRAGDASESADGGSGNVEAEGG